jgi:hypothetical protein
MHSTTNFSHFKIIYGFNSLTPIDLIPLSFKERVSLDREMKTKIVRQLTEGVQLQIAREKKTICTLLKQIRGVNKLFSNTMNRFRCTYIRNDFQTNEIKITTL